MSSVAFYLSGLDLSRFRSQSSTDKAGLRPQLEVSLAGFRNRSSTDTVSTTPRWILSSVGCGPRLDSNSVEYGHGGILPQLDRPRWIRLEPSELELSSVDMFSVGFVFSWNYPRLELSELELS
ncbi:hypothetical protein Dimus_029277 [Dionaea muscipula]